MRNTSLGLLITVSALVGACTADDREPQPGARTAAVDFHTDTIEHRGKNDPTIKEAGRAALGLYLDLAARLEERGVTLEEVEAAIDAGDEERVRRLFGMTPEEYGEAHERLVALAEGRVRNGSGDEVAVPDGLTCKGTWAPCFVAAAELAVRFPNNFGLAIYFVGALTCVWQDCSWDGSSPGTGIRRP